MIEGGMEEPDMWWWDDDKEPRDTFNVEKGTLQCETYSNKTAKWHSVVGAY
jgi:hypothetical protein